MSKKKKQAVAVNLDTTPRVNASRKITLTFPNSQYTGWALYPTDAHFDLTHEQADALADKLRGAARDTRRSMDVG